MHHETMPHKAAPPVELVVRTQNCLGEGPVWDDRTGRLFWTDILAQRLHAFHLATGEHETHELGVKVGVIGLRENGLVLGTEKGFALYQEKSLNFLCDPEADLPDTRLNDGAVDPLGRFWAGSVFGHDNALYRLDPDRTCHRVDAGFGLPNGVGWSPDLETMYLTDSSARTIYAYDFNPATGELDNRRPFIVSQDKDGVPDGLTVDAEGFVWSARWDGWRLDRYDPTGQLERVVKLPVQRPTSLAFGGPNLDELYLTSARTELSEAVLAEQPWAGALLRLRPGVKGRLEFRFKG